MNQMNPNAVLLIAICGVSGYLMGESRGCLIGLLIAMSVCFMIGIVSSARNS